MRSQSHSHHHPEEPSEDSRSSPDKLNVPSSPPFMAFQDARSPTSSEPPIFSSDEPEIPQEILNYDYVRVKRRRTGPWYQRRDDSDSEPLFVLKTLPPESYPSLDEVDEAADAEDNTTQVVEINDATEAAFFEDLASQVDFNDLAYDFDNYGLEDSHLKHMTLLNHVINPPPETPHFRVLVPEIVLFLSNNHLCNLHRSLVRVENLTHLYLRSNEIRSVSPQIAQLRNLQTLDLCHNHLVALPHEMQRMVYPNGKLTKLELAGNPLIEGLTAIEQRRFRARYLELRKMKMTAKEAEDEQEALWEAHGYDEGRQEILWVLAWIHAKRSMGSDSPYVANDHR